MRRNDFVYGQFAENFTVDGLSNTEVCIGDRYRIGSALFEVTQPRVTCYRLCIRLNEPEMAALVVKHGRPGFYFRVLDEGEVAAGGRLNMKVVFNLPRNGDFYICGPSTFMSDLTAGLVGCGVVRDCIHTEMFGAGQSTTPGITDAPRRSPHLPAGPAGPGPLVSFARTGLNVRWGPTFQSLLDLAEACDVPVRWSCRTGVCHTCETGLVAGKIGYRPDPIDAPADGDVLICCSQPDGDVVVDL